MQHRCKGLTEANKRVGKDAQFKIWIHDVHQYMAVGEGPILSIERCPFCGKNLELEMMCGDIKEKK